MTGLMADLRENIKDTLIGKKIKIKKRFLTRHKEYNLETGEVKEIHLPKENCASVCTRRQYIHNSKTVGNRA